MVLDAIVTRAAGRQRFMVAIAGPPGAGKSTLAQDLVRKLPEGEAMVVPMDGFHYDNAVLDVMGLRKRKGAPETFDYSGFAVLLERIRRGDGDVAIPVFDREGDLARAGGAIVRRPVKFIIVEGNYLLLDAAPWNSLAGVFDMSVYIEVPREELKRRLLQRWLELGYSRERAEDWVATNDMPNVDRVVSERRMADFLFAPHKFN